MPRSLVVPARITTRTTSTRPKPRSARTSDSTPTRRPYPMHSRRTSRSTSNSPRADRRRRMRRQGRHPPLPPELPRPTARDRASPNARRTRRVRSNVPRAHTRPPFRSGTSAPARSRASTVSPLRRIYPRRRVSRTSIRPRAPRATLESCRARPMLALSTPALSMLEDRPPNLDRTTLAHRAGTHASRAPWNLERPSLERPSLERPSRERRSREPSTPVSRTRERSLPVSPRRTLARANP